MRGSMTHGVQTHDPWIHASIARGRNVCLKSMTLGFTELHTMIHEIIDSSIQYPRINGFTNS